MNYEPLPEALGDNITDIEVTYNASSCNTETSLDNSMMTTVKGLYNNILQFNSTTEMVRIKWFDESGILHIQKDIDPDEIKYSVSELNRYGKPEYPFMIVNKNHKRISLPTQLNAIKIQRRYMQMAMNTMDAGDSFFDLIEKYNLLIESGTEEFYKKYGMRCQKVYSDNEELNKFIRKISAPTMERAAGNRKRNTFDFIRIRIGIPPREKDDHRKEFIKKNMAGILQIVFGKLNNNKKYQRYGVPVKYLTPDHMVITRQDELELVLKLKGTK